jgi:hypothetical protein
MIGLSESAEEWAASPKIEGEPVKTKANHFAAVSSTFTAKLKATVLPVPSLWSWWHPDINYSFRKCFPYMTLF